MLEATNNTDLVLLMHFAFCFTLNYLILFDLIAYLLPFSFIKDL